MSSDKLVFDLSQEVEGSSNVFVKKDLFFFFLITKIKTTTVTNV